MVVDSKVPLDAFLTAHEAKAEPERDAALAHHARQTREHITKLASKGYQAQFDPTPELVVMFVPSEGIYHAALAADPALLEYGVTHVADSQKAAAHSSYTASPGRHHRRPLRTLAVGLGVIVVLAPAGAFAQPAPDVDTSANAHGDAVHRHHSPPATCESITFTNPLARSRGPGAGAGLL